MRDRGDRSAGVPGGRRAPRADDPPRRVDHGGRPLGRGAGRQRPRRPAPRGPGDPAGEACEPAGHPHRAPGGRGDAKGDPAVKAAATSPVDPTIPPVDSPPVVPPAPVEYPIDLTTALRLAEVENPEIAETRQRIREALALLQGAYALLLPTFNAGINYHGHTGNLQRSSGRILSLSEQSLYFGGGARTLAAESLAIPAVNIVSPLTDVIFEPLAARQNVDRARFDASATANTILLDVATLHFDLIAGRGEPRAPPRDRGRERPRSPG